MVWACLRWVAWAAAVAVALAVAWVVRFPYKRHKCARVCVTDSPARPPALLQGVFGLRRDADAGAHAHQVARQRHPLSQGVRRGGGGGGGGGGGFVGFDEEVWGWVVNTSPN